jgi:hypothetical protein
MMKIRIFFILLLFSVTGCEEEGEERTLLGKWQVTWKVADETLTGHIEFFPDSAILTANGHNQSLLVRHPTQIKYRWNLSAHALNLKPMGKEFTMEYQLLQANNNEWTFRCFDEITLNLSRQTP